MESRNLSSTAWIDEGKLPAHLALDFEDIWSLKPEKLGQVWMYGKLVTTPRYQFSGITHEAEEVPVVLRPLLSWANSLNMGEFHQVLVNFYIGPSHGIQMQRRRSSNTHRLSACPWEHRGCSVFARRPAGRSCVTSRCQIGRTSSCEGLCRGITHTRSARSCRRWTDASTFKSEPPESFISRAGSTNVE